MHYTRLKTLSLRVLTAVSCTLLFSACTPLIDAFTNPILLADSEANPVPIEIDTCSTCTPVVFRDVNEDAGTLQHALDIIQAEHPDMLNYNVEYIQGVLIDLQGRTVLNSDSFWEFLFSDDANLRAMRVTVRNDGSTYTRPSIFTDEDNYNGFITGHNGGRGLNGIKQPFTELLDLPLANSSDVVNQAINSNEYEPSGLSYDGVLYGGGIVLSVVSVYDQDRPNEDMVSSVVYYKNKIAVIIPNENNWNIQAIDSTHPRVEGWPQEQIDQRFYGTVDLFDYFSDRQVFTFSLDGTPN